jgi:tRNA threonylcarbamoyladenosine biosynthesis protein TsaB
MELAIDTSTRHATVGLSQQGNTIAELAWRSERNHSVELVPAIQRLLAHARTEMAALSAIYLAIGPGGFSALRVGMSTAIAMATARKIDLVAIGTLEVEAFPYLRLGSEVRAIIGAGRGRLYLGVFPAGGPASPASKGDIGLVSHDEFFDNLAADAIYCGEAATELAGAIRERLGPTARVVEAPPPTRRAGTLALLGSEKLQAGDCGDPRSLEPIYLRSAQVEGAARRWGSRSTVVHTER